MSLIKKLKKLQPINNLKERKLYIIFMFILVTISVVSSVLGDKVYNIVNYTILIFFSIDTFYELYKSDNRKDYVKHHILDFIALIPFYHGFRMVKFIPLTFQLIRITSIGQRYFLPVVLKLKESGTGRLIDIFMLIFIFLPLPLLWIEPHIKTYSDLIWWEIQTVTTVGYGDILIESDFGRLVGIILMILGVAIITTFTSNLTRILSNPKLFLHHNKKVDQIEELLSTKNFSMDDLDTIESWVELEKQKRMKRNPKH